MSLSLPLAVIDAATIHYVHTDHLGTPRGVSDSTATLVWNWNSDPFGKAAANDDPDGDGTAFVLNLRFPGQYYDSETGLHYNYFRDYDPNTGRYVQSDPIGLAGGLNTYGYVGGNPLYWSDPLGLAEWRGTVLTYIYTPIDHRGRPSHKPGFGLGVFYSLYTLTSDCVRGQKWNVKVRASPTPKGGGAMGFSLPAGMHGSNFVQFEDGLVGQIDPYVFNGSYASISGSIVVGAGSMGSETAMGAAYGEWSWIPAAGADWYAAIMTGYSKVLSATPEKCNVCGGQ